MAPKGEMISPNRKSGTLPGRGGTSEDEAVRVKSASSKRRIVKTQSAAKTTTAGPTSYGPDVYSDNSKSNRKISQAKGMLYTDTDGISNTIDEVDDDLGEERHHGAGKKQVRVRPMSSKITNITTRQQVNGL